MLRVPTSLSVKLDDVVAKTSRFPVCEFETAAAVTAYKVYNGSGGLVRIGSGREGGVGKDAEIHGLGPDSRVEAVALGEE